MFEFFKPKASKVEVAHVTAEGVGFVIDGKETDAEPDLAEISRFEDEYGHLQDAGPHNESITPSNAQKTDYEAVFKQGKSNKNTIAKNAKRNQNRQSDYRR